MWTTDQEHAITERGRSLIVSAAAGSGKTAVLVERLVQILGDTEHRTPADSIIVVTFTNDAAAQMKRRLMKQLSERISACVAAGDDDAVEWLSLQRAGLSAAKICTISSFCFDLVRDNAETLHVSPLFTIADPAQESMLRARAMERVMRTWSKRPEMDVLYRHLCTISDSGIEDAVTAIDKHLGSVAFPSRWLDRAEALAGDAEAVTRRAVALFREGCETVAALMDLAEPFAKRCSTGKKDPFYPIWTDDRESLKQHLALLETASADLLMDDPLTGAVPFPRFSTAKKDVDEEAKQAFKSLRDNYKPLYQKLCRSYLAPLQFLRGDIEIGRELVPLLVQMTRDLREAFREEKRRMNVLSFADAEELALSLLAEEKDGRLCRTALAESLSQTYSLIMVDEYQDSNHMQDWLFKLLSRGGTIDADGHAHYGTNAFVVGDMKQSIYSFRNADPENFRRAVAESVPFDERKGAEMAVIRLNQNFRSAPGVLEFVNALFRRVMTERCGGLTYDHRQQLNPGIHCYDAPDPHTQLLFPKPSDDLPADLEDLQASCIADTIAAMLRDKAPVYTEKGVRPCRPEDFCILLRSVSKKGGPFETALAERGIPVRSDTDTGLLERQEVSLIRDILRVLNDPMDDTALAAVLVSPAVGFTAGDLAKLRLFGSRRQRLYDQLYACAEDAAPSDAGLQKRAADVLATLTALRREADRLPLEECIEAVYDRMDLLSLQSLYKEDAAERRAYLKEFAVQARRYRENADLTSQSGLAGWLRYLDRLSEADRDIEVGRAASDANCVAVKTIHRSKGLQYPFVFVAHMEQAFNLQNDSNVIADEEGLIGLMLYDRERYTKGRSATASILAASDAQKQRGEELRLLYVALTRAQQQLFLVLSPELQTAAVKTATAACNQGVLLDACPEAAPYLAQDAGCMQDLLLYFLFAEGHEAAHLEAAMDQRQGSSTPLADYRVWTSFAAPKAATPAPAEQAAAADEDVLAQMRENLKFRYTSPQTDLISKYSVTQLAHPDGVTSERLAEPAFVHPSRSGRLTGKARGTAVHRVMELIDFKAAAADPDAAIQALLDEGRLTKAEADALDRTALRTFLDSPLGQRLLRAERIEREYSLFVSIGELDLPAGSRLAAQYRGTDGILIGTMDLIFREDGHWILVDYKTDTYMNGAPLRDDAQLLDEYALQVGLYSKAGALVLDAPITEAYLWSFRLGHAVPVDLDAVSYQ